MLTWKTKYWRQVCLIYNSQFVPWHYGAEESLGADRGCGVVYLCQTVRLPGAVVMTTCMIIIIMMMMSLTTVISLTILQTLGTILVAVTTTRCLAPAPAPALSEGMKIIPQDHYWTVHSSSSSPILCIIHKNVHPSGPATPPQTGDRRGNQDCSQFLLSDVFNILLLAALG